MLKKRNFVTKAAKIMYSGMVVFFFVQPVNISTAQDTTKKDSKIHSIQKAIEIKEMINERLVKVEQAQFNMIVHNYDTIYTLKLEKERKKVLANKKKETKPKQQATTYKMFPIAVDSQDLADFTAKYPNDTIPLKIEIERIPKKRNIFNFLKSKRKTKKNDN